MINDDGDAELPGAGFGTGESCPHHAPDTGTTEDTGTEDVIRAGTPADVHTVLALQDAATEWLAAQGRTGQWGTRPHSISPRRIAHATGWAESGGLYLASRSGRVVGALAVGDAVPYVSPATEPELYINLLVADPRRRGSGTGARLLRYAARLAERRGVRLLRVDCYAGDDQALVRYYERQGFTATEPFTVELPDRRWPGQVLERRLP
ncbi:GNAT family N-acetyltransferase [Plantactinospora sp. GCM10030261]|uniref:GNAT family N-acetyltransferase n=1 Tax=Plantactinospora sp. GCM10030261 TaxID=3273420 RepID=UPI0036095A6F